MSILAYNGGCVVGKSNFQVKFFYFSVALNKSFAFTRKANFLVSIPK